LELPTGLWSDPEDLRLIDQALGLFPSEPVLLTDRLTNTVYLNPEAERLLGERGEGLVNRVAFSLLGIEKGGRQAAAVADALLGKGHAWRGVVYPEGREDRKPVFCEASAIKRAGRLVCGILRLGASPQQTHKA
jgi:PAS domain-containing protein